MNYANSYMKEGKQCPVNQIRITQGFYFEVADSCAAPLLLPLANPELCWNNWIHLRFTDDSMPAWFYICMEIKR